jgi:hypothetical protein
MDSKWFNWMTKNLNYDLQLSDICIPGTHHSESSTLEPILSPCIAKADGSTWGDFTEGLTINPFLWMLGSLNPIDVVKRLAIAQYSTVYEQLESGARYLDFRVCYDQEVQTFHTVHTVKGGKTEIGLADVRRYLDECDKKNYKEVVILEFDHNPSLDHAAFNKLIELYLGRHLFRREEGSPALGRVTLKEIVGSSAKPKAIIIYHFDTKVLAENHMVRLPAPKGYGYWSVDSLNDIYKSSDNVNEMENNLTKELGKSKDHDKLTKLQYVLAAGAGQFFAYFWTGWSLEDMESVLPERIQLYMNKNATLFKKVNVIFIDFFNEYEDFLMDDILTLNKGGTVKSLPKKYRLKFSRLDGGDIEWPAIQQNGPKIKSKYGYACNQGDNWMGIGQHSDASAWLFEDIFDKGIHYLKRSTNNYIGVSSSRQLGTYDWIEKQTCGWHFRKIGILQRNGGNQEVCCLNAQGKAPRVFACKPDDKTQTVLYVEKEYVYS